MSLARSASGPGGLSINTGSANLFGSSTSQPPAGGGLFGTTTSQPAQTGSLFGTVASQPQQTDGLFGGTTTQTPASQPQQQTGSLFGQSTTTQPQQQQQQTAGKGLFGNMGTQTGGGLFGASTQAQPAQTGSLFGGTSTQQQSQATTGGLFGGTTNNTGSTLGKTGTGGGLFGQSAQTQPTTTPAFGLTMGQSTNAQQQQQQQVVPGVRIDLSNIKSTTRFNDLQETLQKEIAMIDEAIQKCIRDKEAVDAFLPAHAEQLAAIPTDVSFVTRKSEGAHNALKSDVLAIDQLRELVKADADNARLSFRAIDNQKLPMQYHQAGLWAAASTSSSSSTVRAGASNAAGAGTGAGGGSSSSNGTVGPGSGRREAGPAGASAAAGGTVGAAAADDAQSNTDLITFFSRTADEMADMMRKFESHLGEIEVHLHGVQGSMLEQLQRAAARQSHVGAAGTAGGVGAGAGAGAGSASAAVQGGVDERVIELAAVLRDFEESILKVAGVVGSVKEGVTGLQLKDFMGHGS